MATEDLARHVERAHGDDGLWWWRRWRVSCGSACVIYRRAHLTGYVQSDQGTESPVLLIQPLPSALAPRVTTLVLQHASFEIAKV